MHEGKHGILDGVDDIDSLFGVEEEHEHADGHEHVDEHEHADGHEHTCCDSCKK